MARNLVRLGGGFAAALSIATSAVALQQRPTTTAPTTTAPTTTSTAAPRTYAECLRSYAARTNATAVCQRLFPNAAPAATTTTPADTTTAPTREPVDITPELNELLDAWRNRPRTPATPADPLAVVPQIQATCAAYASLPERWRRCVAAEWDKTGLKGQSPQVLRDPPVVEPPPVQPPVVQPPTAQPPVQPPVVETPVVQSKPPIQTPPSLTPETVEPEPVRPPPVVVSEPPPAAVVPPPMVAPPPASKPPATPIWFWLLALLAAGGAGFGVTKLLNRARKPASRPSTVEAAPCPDIALVVDPGVVVLTPDGPPRAGMAVSLRFERSAGGGEVRLDYPALETAP